MPGTSRAQRAEAKYNVVFDCESTYHWKAPPHLTLLYIDPNLGLHSAAASGNLGLVKYALDHGQPVNSALDGVLPLHAASFGGSDLVVRLLIEYGADVNAPRSVAAPPMFDFQTWQLNIVHRLPRRYSTDKHRGSNPPLVINGVSGSTSLHFACMHGHMTVVLTLLLHGAHPERTDKHGMTPEMIARQNGFVDCADVLQKWAHNKDKDLRERDAIAAQHIEDHASKESHAYCGSLDCLECATRKRIRVKRSIDNAFHILRHSSSSNSATVTPPQSAGSISASNSVQPPSPTDRPLGEYTFYNTSDNAVEELPPRRPSLPQIYEVPRNASTPHRSRRPSNLSGTSSNRPRSAGSDADQSIGRVKNKISLLNIFKRGNDTPDSNSSSAVTSASVSPAPASTLGMTALSSRSNDALASSPSESAFPLPSTGNQLHQRFLGEIAPSPLSSSEPRRRYSRESLHAATIDKSSPSTRPGILRAVPGRTSSSGHSGQGDTSRSPSGPPSVRALRFDPASQGVASGTRPSLDSHHRNARAASRSPARPVRGQASVNSLRSRSPGGGSWGMRLESEPEHVGLASPPPSAREEAQLRDSIEEADESAYGQPLEPQDGVSELKMRLSDLSVKARRMSTDSRASDLDSQDTVNHLFECPFSINLPPPQDDSEEALAQHGPGRASQDSRVRGNSLSSMVTDSSGGPPSSCVPTPALQQTTLPSPFVFSPSLGTADLPSPGEVAQENKELGASVVSASPGRRARGALDIDIRTISSHAQAEALVQRAQQRILEMREESDDEEVKTLGINLGEGHTPLSAKLAAYGQVLAIERKFKEEEEKKRQSLTMESTSGTTLASQGGLVQRKLSLQERAHSDPAGASRHVRRPHTSDGEREYLYSLLMCLRRC